MLGPNHEHSRVASGECPQVVNLPTEAQTGQMGVAPAISHAVLLTSAQLGRGLVRLFFILVVARELGPRQFGVYALLLAIVEVLAVASGSGCADYLTREAAKWGGGWESR